MDEQVVYNGRDHKVHGANDVCRCHDHVCDHGNDCVCRGCVCQTPQFHFYLSERERVASPYFPEAIMERQSCISEVVEELQTYFPAVVGKLQSYLPEVIE